MVNYEDVSVFIVHIVYMCTHIYVTFIDLYIDKGIAKDFVLASGYYLKFIFLIFLSHKIFMYTHI